MKARQEDAGGWRERSPIKSWVGVKKPGGETKRSRRAKGKLDLLFDVGAGDHLQPKRSLEFLIDMRGERKSCLPPVIGSLGVEHRRDERQQREQERIAKEQREAQERFKVVGSDFEK